GSVARVPGGGRDADVKEGGGKQWSLLLPQAQPQNGEGEASGPHEKGGGRGPADRDGGRRRGISSAIPGAAVRHQPLPQRGSNFADRGIINVTIPAERRGGPDAPVDPKSIPGSHAR